MGTERLSSRAIARAEELRGSLLESGLDPQAVFPNILDVLAEVGDVREITKGNAEKVIPKEVNEDGSGRFPESYGHGISNKITRDPGFPRYS